MQLRKQARKYWANTQIKAGGKPVTVSRETAALIRRTEERKFRNVLDIEAAFKATCPQSLAKAFWRSV